MCTNLTKSDTFPTGCERSFSLHRTATDPGVYSYQIPDRLVLVPSAVEKQSSGLIRDVFYECKKLASYALPLSFSFNCLVFKSKPLINRQNEYGIVVVLCPSSHGVEDQRWRNYGEAELIGACFAPKFIKPGKLRIRLVSNYIKPDIVQDEAGFFKEENHFRGGQVEKQFACLNKGNGDLCTGKVVVESVRGETSETIFEINLYWKNKITPDINDTDEQWALLAIKELACMLRINDEENWRILAHELHVSEAEISYTLTPSPDPIARLFLLYKRRGGTPQRFVQSLYAASRLVSVSSSLPTRTVETNVSDLNSDEVKKRIREALRNIDDKDKTEDDEDATIILSQADWNKEMYAPLTPPISPMKRKSSEEDRVNFKKRCAQ
ncbi:DgyrCDS12099 [Dimorphilus gyrociliatus]|uniref:DgyrCDS12099 n=1 Tax=Dimorphilus gyrociliatus TaxID=2664684 RepID=A0A7I8W5F2_9ANNE|nr:DgyrCDS12099 [Dimorphilus gyrociliatus]